ncbi:CPBP family intramembrane glutamic endopeptidase [Dactylosporangium sucinum]|uniref:CAAX prenyl protease 2/Lysostaphin resistance protein A-like domain-containing protein n=1 Tax=Dactylosporangium sucinum TaxID=1424081 RepID=A0A917UC52_9ACTN|nr:CPBP family intramembrane glutamic endopeptidase [Dactylosporangium sucinum]GGM78490.1 hypothetical protein GCM10007977_095050 [Dactylosporangium sucinum]
MTTRTLCLSLLVLLCASFPAQVFELANASGRGRPGAAGAAPRRPDRAMAGSLMLAVALVALAALAATVAPMRWTFPPVDWLWYAAAVAFGFLTVPLEWAVGAAYVAVRYRRLAGIGLHRLVGATSASVVLAYVVAGAAEEVLFRGVGLHVLEGVLGWPVAAALAITSVVYGLNHLYFGAIAVAQKTFTGVGFGLLYLLGGHNVLVPLVAHAVQNLVVLTVLPRREAS